MIHLISIMLTLALILLYSFILIACICFFCHYLKTDYYIDRQLSKCVKITFLIFLIIFIALFPILIKL